MNDLVMIARRILYSGHVQGVGFRFTVKQIASGYEVTGWVRNLDDGRVEMCAKGQSTEVEGLISAVSTSHLSTHIRETEQEVVEASAVNEVGFEIRH